VEISEIPVSGYERVVRGVEPASRFHAIIAVHNTNLGPAVGGTRLWSYANEDAALTDALRLSRGMTYKSALAGLAFGGGKSVILRPPHGFDREQLFRAHGRFVEALGGKYVTAEDVGTGTADMEFVKRETSHVAGLAGRSGDPSPQTARGVFRAIQAAAQFRWKSRELKGRRVSLQGCGNVGRNLARLLSDAGCKLTVSDVDQAKASATAGESGAAIVAPEELVETPCDIFSPCALGGIINDETLPRLQGLIVAGGANNQLLEDRHGDVLAANGVLYAPDYAANAGGIINGAIELLDWSREHTLRQIDRIYETILQIFGIAERSRIPTYQAADRMAEKRFSR